ncbi:MAG: ComEA family DNA-binding protein [Betaproteobacteria bacterium]
MKWRELRIANFRSPLDWKLAGLLLVLAMGCVSLALERQRTRLSWCESPSRTPAVRAATPSLPAQPEKPPAKRLAPATARELPANRPPATRLDLNRATARELEALPGIGPALARRILAYRESRGSFQAVEELEMVSGIGPARLERLRGLLFVKEEPGDRR